MRNSVFVFAALATLGVATPASPAGDAIVSHSGTEYVIPAASPVGAPTFGTGEEAFNARFTGAFVLTGTFHTQGNAENRMTILKPDAALAARLPRWKESARPAEIWFENAEAAIKAIVNAQTLARLNAGKLDAFDKHVSLDVDRYTISIECDTASYTVRFIKVHAPAQTAQAVQIAEGC